MAQSTEEVALDLSCAPLDLSVKPSITPISISEHINGVEHFSFLDTVANKATHKDTTCQIDVEAWHDSLWNVSSVLKLEEVRDDWRSEDEASNDDCVPWRCCNVIEPIENNMGHNFAFRELVSDDDSDQIPTTGSGISNSNEFFVFSEPLEDTFETVSDVNEEPGTSLARVKVITSDQSLAANCELEEFSSPTFKCGSQSVSLLRLTKSLEKVKCQAASADIPATMTGPREVEGIRSMGSQHTGAIEPVAGHQSVLTELSSSQTISTLQRNSCSKEQNMNDLLNCWSNDDPEYTICHKRWRVDIKGEMNEFENCINELPCDEPMIEVSDSEEGDDIVELPIIENESDEKTGCDDQDTRSILHDNELQLFSSRIMVAQTGSAQESHSNAATSILESGNTQLNESDKAKVEVESALMHESSILSDSLEPLMLSDTDFDLDELFKVESNNNCDDFLSDLLIDLP